jgi:hypothetical protein
MQGLLLNIDPRPLGIKISILSELSDVPGAIPVIIPGSAQSAQTAADCELWTTPNRTGYAVAGCPSGRLKGSKIPHELVSLEVPKNPVDPLSSFGSISLENRHPLGFPVLGVRTATPRSL